ncbi:MAG: hypothetical protein IT382_20810 [Deltaproteobacteria bacterium]|nr:hypothetical protein [Deltaproteobacteria bacterium]
MKPGGFLLTKDHQGDARDAAALPGLELQPETQEHRGTPLVEDTAGTDALLGSAALEITIDSLGATGDGDKFTLSNRVVLPARVH